MADILVVDDNRANREALASLLEVAGHSARRASGARQALESALAAPPELVISDVLMPGMDGYVLVRELRADPRTAALPVIFYTAYFAGQDAQDLAQAHGVARVLVKPSDNDLILRTVEEVLSETTAASAAGAAMQPAAAELGGEHLRIVVDQLLEKTATLEAQQRRIERLNRTLETMSAVNALIVRVGERGDLLAEACRVAVERGGFGFAAIRLAHDERVVSSGEGSRDPRIDQFPVPPEATVCNDIEASQAPGRGSALQRGLRAYAVLPLVFSGHLSGALLLYARAKDVFDDEEMRLLHELAGDIAFALHHIAQKARMDYLAYHDSLTDLPNRSLFVDRLGQALIAARRERRFAAAVFLDLERFRMVNESFGRRAGDELLREAATRLCAAASDEDTVARVGADHFAIAVAPCEKPADTVQGLLGRVAEAFSRPVLIDGVELRVTLKGGVAVFPGDGSSTEVLCSNAETALNHAKQVAASYLFYAPEMNARVAESLALEHRLRRAIEDGRLALHYQPKMDVRTGRLAGLEALIRWQDPVLGAVPPAKFVSLMEETGMILVAGRWALGHAVQDILRWQSHGLVVPRTAVNVSAIQLRQKDFVDSVLEAIAGFGRAKPLLDVEITESVLVDDIDETTRKLQTLRRAGVEISVDDFGTGYCSLSYLARLPVDVLKIDRSFVVRMRDAGYPRNIVAMIVSLAHTLGLKVIAEGVEDDEQVRLLRDLGCDQIQGYLVSRPVPPQEIEALLRRFALAPGNAAAA
ncbi:MAG TPA: EAL domain-containing protein [Burkholderiales bacterium]|nr:EAL domain-containing protein [Burkholderiales bacterium]